MTSNVVEFPTRKTCFRCVHFDNEVAYCQLFDEPIDSEVYAAKDCNGFEAADGDS